MVATLPRNIQLKLEQTLNQWRQWRCDPPLTCPPKIISAFSSGISNHSVLVEARGHFVIRIDGIHAANNSLSRSTEWRVLQMAHEADLAPCPRYFNPELGVLVCDHLSRDSNRVEDLGETAILLRSIHRLPAFHHRLDLRERITRYEKLLEHQGGELPVVMVECQEAIQGLLSKLADENHTLVPCHNDLLAANRILSGNRLRAIDWEYCAMGSFWFDLAVVAIGDDMDAGQKQGFVNRYLGRDVSSGEWLAFSRNCIVYQYLELLWYLTNTPACADLSQRMLSLEQALNHENY